MKPLLILGCVFMLSAYNQLFAAKGDTKAQKGVTLKFSGFNLKGFSSDFFSFRPTVFYKGTFNSLSKPTELSALEPVTTFQRGNTVFILTYKPKVILPKFKTPEKPRF